MNFRLLGRSFNSSKLRQSQRSTSYWKGEEFSVPVPWGKIAGRKWGDPKGHPWIALHGWLDNAGSFDEMGPLFLKNHRLYCIDYPGHGLSSHIPPGMMYSFIEAPTYVGRVAKHLELEKYGLMGHSFGGVISMLTAGFDSEPITHVISLDVIRGYIDATNKETVEGAKKVIQTLFVVEEKLNSMSKKTYTYEDMLEKLQKSLNRSNNEPEDMKGIVKTLLKRGVTESDCGKFVTLNRDLRFVIPTLQRLTVPLYKDILKKINVPHLIIKSKQSTFYGEKSEVMEIVSHLRENNPKFEYIEVDGIHHMHMKEPAKPISVIEDFLKKYPLK